MNVKSSLPSGAYLFDRQLIRRRRRRVSQLDWERHRFLFDEVSDRLAERVLDVSRQFDQALDMGCHDGAFGQRLLGYNRISRLVSADLSLDLLSDDHPGDKVIMDDEFFPFKAQQFDLIGSVLSLHWVNDLPGTLIQVSRCLKADGLFLGAMFGADTLIELKDCLVQAEIEVKGGMSPRVSPFLDVRDAGSLMQRAGFALPVTDTDTLTFKYQNAFALMHELRGMGEASALVERLKTFTGRRVLLRAAEIYQEKYQGSDGQIPATFQIVYLGGWAPHENQQQPLKPGSAKSSLRDVL